MILFVDVADHSHLPSTKVVSRGSGFQTSPFQKVRDGRQLQFILSRSHRVSLDREIGEQLTDLGLAHLQQVPLPMKKNDLLGPEHIGILGADAVMQSANTIPHLVE